MQARRRSCGSTAQPRRQSLAGIICAEWGGASHSHDGRSPYSLGRWQAQSDAAAGYPAEAQNILYELQEIAKERYVSAYGVARIHAALGRKEEALDSLERSYKEHSVHMTCLKTDPRLDDLRPHPRFQDLLRRMNFPS